MSTAGALRQTRCASSQRTGAPTAGRKLLFRRALPHSRRRAGERRRSACSASKAASTPPRSSRTGANGANGASAGAKRTAQSSPKNKEELRQAGRAQRIPAGAVLLADHGARRRHLGAQRRLHAQHAADAGQLRAALRARRALRPGGAGRDLLRRTKSARPILFRQAARRW